MPVVAYCAGNEGDPLAGQAEGLPSGEGGGIDLDFRWAPLREPEQAFPDPVPGALGNPRPPFFDD